MEIEMKSTFNNRRLCKKGNWQEKVLEVKNHSECPNYTN